MKVIPATPGSYIIWFRLGRRRRITIGRLGVQLFESGYYAYCGSAFGPGGLKSRLAHHLRKSERPRWHIDYLKNVSTVVDVWFSTAAENGEHRFAAALAALPGAQILSEKFGASDCTCRSHLVHFPEPVPIDELRKSVPGMLQPE